MKYAAGVLVLLTVSRGGFPPGSSTPFLPPLTAMPDPARQEWLADPVVPGLFAGGEEAVEVDWPDQALSLEAPPLEEFAAPPMQEVRPDGAREGDPAFPRGVGGLDVQRWQEEDELRRIREWMSDGSLGLPLLVPQLFMESVLPRGLRVGPTTFLYPTASTSTSLALVVFDQILFHEAEFLAVAQARATDDPSVIEELTRGQRRVFRKSFMAGFRASYAMPSLTMNLVLQTAAEQGVVGYLLAPPIGGALLYLKGIDQKVRLHDDIKVRFKIAPGQDWARGIRSSGGLPALSVEMRFCDLPIGLIASFDVSRSGLIPEFIGIGTSLDSVEELVGLEEGQRHPAFREQ